ncbi:MAG: hypothetical protein HY299_02385 [Verrucomicrobia bacterium]|nr:hypothetical protein [Verrucomicrobiota bacterium]
MRSTRGLSRRFPLACAVLLAVTCSVSAAAPVQLQFDPFCGFPRLGISGDPGDSFTVQGANTLGDPLAWQPLLDFTLETGDTSWCDSESQAMTRRFYRAIRLDAPPPQVRPRNFRLIDHTGRGQELYYKFNDATVTAYVLLFVGDSVSNALSVLPELKTLSASTASQGVQFWIVSSLWGNNRSNLIAEAKQYDVAFPVLHDRAGLVTREFGITKAPEVVALKNRTFEIFYRGAVSEVQGAGAAHYLSDALDRFLQDQPVPVAHVRPLGRPVALHGDKTPDYVTEIAPILQARCVRCHSPGGIAPWAMTNHTIVQDYGDRLKDEVLAMRMPPWHADPHIGAFANDSSLRPDEADNIIQWLNAGAPRGAGDDPLAKHIADAPDWPLGTPDIILKIDNQTLPANGVVDYRYLTIDPKLASDIWLRAAVVRPGNRKVVHHSLVFLGSANSSLGGLSGYFAGYVPGLDPVLFPIGTGKLLPKGTKLTFQMHYIAIGSPQTDQTELGLYLLPSAPARKLQTLAAYDVFFQIPPGESEHTTSASAVFTKSSLLYEVSPHQHLRGKWFKYELQLANGTKKPLINIPRYVFNWQRLYRFADPISVPAGSRILCTGAWDNSPQNLDNPDPNAYVGFGEQTFNEMFIGYYNFSEQ